MAIRNSEVAKGSNTERQRRKPGTGVRDEFGHEVNPLDVGSVVRHEARPVAGTAPCIKHGTFQGPHPFPDEVPVLWMSSIN